MHVAKQLHKENVEIKINGIDSTLDQLFPGYGTHDRFGLVVNSPLGSLGASLLLQAAIVQFFEIAPERREAAPMYPEIYLFHVGGRHGDHSNFDFWPPRKEVFVPANDPLALVEAINDRAITRLAIPDLGGGDAACLEDGPSTWAEQYALQHRLVSSYAYGVTGETCDADVVLESSHPSFEDNASATLDANRTIETIYDTPVKLRQPGPTKAVDVERWIDYVKERMGELDRHSTSRVAALRLREVDGRMTRRESFRRIQVADVLRLVTCL